MDAPAVFRILVGLGNPGPEYVNTRHNIGFLVVEELASRWNLKFQFEAQWDAQAAKSDDGVWLLKPMTFMNLSGSSVGHLSKYYKIEPAAVLAIADDAAIPLGNLRIRKEGSSGGHRGIESVLMHLGTSQVPRLRVGIGAAKGEMQDHVLGKFLEEELPLVKDTVKRAADAAEFAIKNGIEAAMNSFNQNTQKTTTTS